MAESAEQRTINRDINRDQIDNWFTYHPPTGDQAQRYELMRMDFKRLAEKIIERTPCCADQTAALRMLRECAMAVNQTIACNEDAKP
jgi:hypothetical protein